MHVCWLLERGPGSSCLAISTRRRMCAAIAYMLQNNANHRDTLLPQQGDRFPSLEGLFEASQKDLRVDFAAAADSEVSLAGNMCKSSGSASVPDKGTDGMHASVRECVAVIANTRTRSSTVGARESEEAARMRDESKNRAPQFEGGNLVGSQTLESLEDNDVGDGEENMQSGILGQSMDALSQQDRIVSRGLLKILEAKGWAEPTRQFLETHRREFSFPLVCNVLFWLKDVDLALSLFRWACENMGHDVTVYHAYLKVLVEAKRFDEMWHFLVKMKDNSMQVSVITFCIMIRACGVAEELAMAVTVFNRAPDYGINLSGSLHQALLTVLFKLNSVKEARLFYSRMIKTGLQLDVHTFNALIDGFGLTSSIKDVNKSLDSMLKAGIKPDLSTYNALICAYCNTSAVYSAISIFADLKEKGLHLRKKTFYLMIESLCKMGKLSDALNLIVSVRSSFLPQVLSLMAALTGLLSGNQIPLAIKLFQAMEEEGLTSHWIYIGLCNGLRQCVQTTEIRNFLTFLCAKHDYSNANVCLALLHNLTSLGDLVEAETLFKRFADATAKPNLSVYATMICFYCRVELLDRALQLLSDLTYRGCKPTLFCYAPLISALLKVHRVADALKCFKEMQEFGHEGNDITCDFLLRELCIHDMIDDVPEVLTIVLRNNFTVRTVTFFQLIKCMCRAGKIEESNIVFRSLCALKCINISTEAALQSTSVIKVMGASCLV